MAGEAHSRPYCAVVGGRGQGRTIWRRQATTQGRTGQAGGGAERVMTSRTRGKKKTIGEVCEGGQYRAVMSAQETLERMTTIGRTDITTFHDDQGNILPTSEWTPEMGQQVSKIESVVKNVAAGDGHVDTVLKISIWDKMKALEQLVLKISIWDKMGASEAPRPHHPAVRCQYDRGQQSDRGRSSSGRCGCWTQAVVRSQIAQTRSSAPRGRGCERQHAYR